MAIYKDTTSTEVPIYGSSRLGQYKGGVMEGHRTLGHRNYELSNHLGNVLSVITDNAGMKPDSVWATVMSTSDYYPFGLEMKGRSYNDTTAYRYGFNGKEKDNFNATVYDYGFRIYNPEIGKFLSVDPLTKSYPWYTPYQFAGNKPIAAIDLDGLEEVIRINYQDASGKITKTSIILVKANDVRWETNKIWKALISDVEGGENPRFGNNLYFEGYDKYKEGSHAKSSQKIAPLRGELTISKLGDTFTYFGYSKEITEDALYKSAASEHNFGTAYDLSGGLQNLGNGTAAFGLGVTATVVGAEIGVPLMKVGNSIALVGDGLEMVTDFFHGDVKEGLKSRGRWIVPSWIHFKNALNYIKRVFVLSIFKIETMASLITADLKNIIFDLGGVIINLSVSATVNAFAKASGHSTEKIASLVHSQQFMDYEKGLISDDEFRTHIRSILNWNASADEIDHCWNAMLGDIPLKRLTLLEKLKNDYQIFLLSNTNEIHLRKFNQILFETSGKVQMDEYFHRAYYSHRMKMRKPDVEIFEFVLKENKLQPANTLFLDDNLSNLQGAALAGIKTFHVESPDSIFSLFP